MTKIGLALDFRLPSGPEKCEAFYSASAKLKIGANKIGLEPIFFLIGSKAPKKRKKPIERRLKKIKFQKVK